MRVDQASKGAVLAGAFRRGDEGSLREVLCELWPRIACVLARKHATLVALEDVRDVVHVGIEHGWRRQSPFHPARGTLGGRLYVIAAHEVADFATSPGTKPRRRTTPLKHT